MAQHYFLLAFLSVVGVLGHSDEAVKALTATVKKLQASMQSNSHEVEELQHIISEQKAKLDALTVTKSTPKQTRRKRRLSQEPEVSGPERQLSAAALTAYMADANSAMDHIWLLICGALVMFMQAGFAVLEAGACREKNVQNILMKNLVDVCVGTIGWYAIGWALAYGGPYEDGMLVSKFAGSEQFFGIGFADDNNGSGTITPTTGPLNWFFQWAFCSAAATIVSGGVAERVQFPGYMVYSACMTTFIYPIVVAWTWGYGWLAGSVNSVNFMDFAGSGIVHMSGGVGALVGAIIAGPRKERWEKPDEFAPHNLPLVVLGTFILWFGWYGFNCGSTLSLHDASTGMMAAHVAMNTTIAAATGGLTVFALRYAILRKYDVGGLCNGILAGLVSITAGCGNVWSGSALAIGLIGGLVYQGTSALLTKFKLVDDPLDAFAIHGAAGAWGVIAAALFDFGGLNHVHAWSGWSCMTTEDGGCMEGAGGALLGANIVEVIAICAWVGILSAIIFGILSVAGVLRAPDEMQDDGMDLVKHSPPKAYCMESASREVTISNSKVVPS